MDERGAAGTERPAGGASNVGMLAALAVTLVLAAGTAYEAAVADGAIPLGSQPGEAPAGEGVVFAAALTALVAGSGLVSAFAIRPALAPRLVALLPVAGAGFMLARWYAFDPYYLPTLRRASEGGIVAGSWVLALVVTAAIAATAAAARVRPGFAVAGLVMLAEASTAFVIRLGH